jgi:hypothetical protein
VPGGITGPPCHGHINIGTAPPSWELDARLTTLFYKKITVAKSKEVKKECSLANDDDDDDDDDDYYYYYYYYY